MKTRKVTVLVQGGLGNQLFCYALARSYSLMHDRICVLDNTSGYLNDQYKRVNRLKELRLVDGVEEAKVIKGLVSRISKFFPIKYRTLIKEKHIGDVDILNVDFIADNICFVGYWQNEKYIKSIKSKLIDELVPGLTLSDDDQELMARIKSSNSVFIHIRRHQYSHQLQIGYYEDAIRRLKEKVESPEFFVFGDDIEWVKNQSIFKEKCEVINHKEDTSEMDDFSLMNSCKHAIIANSSFSWWAAWLSNDEEQVVICPDHSAFGLEMAEGWLKMKVIYKQI